MIVFLGFSDEYGDSFKIGDILDRLPNRVLGQVFWKKKSLFEMSAR